MRSIPACAGEPTTADANPAPLAVYPRVCGGTRMLLADADIMRGLSPRVRGNPGRVRAGLPCARSIPACAGEPGLRCCPLRGATVYPRVCGGTCCRQPQRYPRVGLSPRVRGNLAYTNPPAEPAGSIPACAGEPARRRVARPRQEVYPRVCGGTAALGAIYRGGRGLSPRVRGNPKRTLRGRSSRRSIPACAGEPSVLHDTAANNTVYPRVCGGTARRAVRGRPA